MRKLFTLLYILTGIHAGACVSIAAVDLKYIMSITNADELLRVFSPLLKNAGILMAPQFFILLILCLIFSFKAFREKKSVTTHTPLFLILAYFAVTLLVHIPINNAIFFDIDKFSNQKTDLPHMLPEKKEWEKIISNLGISNEDKIIIYDNSDVISSCRCWYSFIFFGHKPSLISVLNGGLSKWKKENGKTRVYFYPITGRTHQLRVHAAHKDGLNTPVIGDDLYGKKEKR